MWRCEDRLFHEIKASRDETAPLTLALLSRYLMSCPSLYAQSLEHIKYSAIVLTSTRYQYAQSDF